MAPLNNSKTKNRVEYVTEPTIGGLYKLEYNEAFLAVFRNLTKSTERRWYPETKKWFVSLAKVDQVNDLCRLYFPDFDQSEFDAAPKTTYNRKTKGFDFSKIHTSGIDELIRAGQDGYTGQHVPPRGPDWDAYQERQRKANEEIERRKRRERDQAEADRKRKIEEERQRREKKQRETPIPPLVTGIMTDFAILYVTDKAPKEVIRAAYKALAMVHHPDKGGSPRKMQEINEAYERLKSRGRA